MRIFLVMLSVVVGLFAETLDIQQFESDVYSKESKSSSKKISLDMIIEGRSVDTESFKVVDALNIVIGSFYAEDLLTSRGKEGLKKALIDYSAKKYSIDIDAIYIQRLYVVTFPAVDEIVEALKREGCCK